MGKAFSILLKLKENKMNNYSRLRNHMKIILQPLQCSRRPRKTRSTNNKVWRTNPSKNNRKESHLSRINLNK